MREFLSNFVGQVVGALFTAACTYLGFGPDAVVKAMIDGLPHWVTPNRLRGTLLVLAVLTAVFVFRSWKAQGGFMGWKKKFRKAMQKPEEMAGSSQGPTFIGGFARNNGGAGYFFGKGAKATLIGTVSEGNKGGGYVVEGEDDKGNEPNKDSPKDP